MSRALTPDELAHFKARIVSSYQCAVHFTVDGNTFDPVTGNVTKDRHINVINKRMFMNFTKDDAIEVGRLCGVKVKVYL